MAEPNFQVVKITTEETYALRTAVLRADTPTSDPKYAEDSKPGTVHLGIFDENTNLIATSTWVINPWQDDSSAMAIQLRGMAVATNQQKSGLGKLLLDEPLTGLDVDLHGRLLEDLSKLLRVRGTTVLHVTHDKAEASAIADRVLDLRQLIS